MRALRSSHHPPKKFASVPFLASPSDKNCERSVPPVALRKKLRAFRSSHHPPKKCASAPSLPSPSEKNCERSVPPSILLKNVRAFRSSHHPPRKSASAPFLPSPSESKPCYRPFSKPCRQWAPKREEGRRPRAARTEIPGKSSGAPRASKKMVSRWEVRSEKSAAARGDRGEKREERSDQREAGAPGAPKSSRADFFGV